MQIEKSELNIYDVEDLQKQLLNELKKDSITIDMKNVQKIDATIVQLFISTQKTLKESSKDFKLTNLNDELIEILKGYFCITLIEEQL